VLNVSAGPGKAVVPPVHGITQRSADRRVRRSGFIPRDQPVSSSTVAKGLAIGTKPVYGTKLDKGATITVLISAGPKLVKVPDVTTQSLDAATAELTSAGFTAHRAAEQESTQDPGTVLSQNPKAGAMVPKGTTINLTVAKAARPTVPSEIGKTQDDAINDISNLGLVPQVSTRSVTDATQDGKVIAQTPAAGTIRSKGAHVQLVVGRLAPSPGGSTTTPSP
jgi:serine/threonine-protein kinase